MRNIVAALAACLVLLSVGPSHAAYVITYSPGGVIDDFIAKYSAMRDSGRDVVVAGECTSACTTLVGIIKPEHLCFTSKAVLGVHSALDISTRDDGSEEHRFSPTGTRMMWSRYPRAMQEAIRARGWDGNSPHPDVIYLDNKVVLSIFRKCSR